VKLRKWLIYLVFTCVLSSVFVGLYTYHRYQVIVELHKKQLVSESLHQLTYSQREFHEIEAQFTSTMELMASSRYLFDYLDEPNREHKTLVEDMWFSIATSQQWFTDIRLVTLDGDAPVGISYQRDSQSARINTRLVAPLEDDFFDFAAQVKNGRTASWGIVFKSKKGRYIQPYQPVFTIFTPVHRHGKRLGYLLLSVDVWLLSSVLDYSPKSEFVPEVLTLNGDYLISRHRDKLFGFLLPDRKAFNFSNSRPAIWQQMQAQQPGYAYQNEELYVFSDVKFMNGEQFYLMIHFNRDQIIAGVKSDVDNLLHKALLSLLGLCLFAMPMAYIIHIYRKRSLENKLAIAALHGMSAVMISDSRHRVIQVNREFESMIGYSNEQVVGKNALKLLTPKHKQEQLLMLAEGLEKGGFWQGELTSVKSSGEQFTSITRVKKISNSKVRSRYHVTSIVDISERKELEERLRYLSERDGLTSCWNRRKFDSELQKQARLTKRYANKYRSCLVLVDIDHFKRVNDQYGHDEGDRVIQQVAKVLDSQLRDTDFLARIGGEEFAIILANTPLSGLDVMLNRLRVAVEIEPSIQVTVSIGVSDISGDPKSSYKFADIALYESKEAGRNRVSICSSDSDIA